jgi:hypothetical protein
VESIQLDIVFFNAETRKEIQNKQRKFCFILRALIREGFNKKNIIFMEFSIRGRLGLPLFHTFFGKKTFFPQNIFKDA